MAFDIIRLAKNKHRRDFIIADLHGKHDCLQSVIKKLGLKEGDRLFIAGDLVDRGEDSLGVIETILKSDIEIHVVKGNHENMTLSSIEALERVIAYRGGNFDLDEEELRALLPQLIADKSISQDTRNLIGELQNHIDPANGGVWIVDLFFKEFSAGKIKFNESGKFVYEVESKVKMVYDYLDNLPYIISVAGDERVAPFNIVHADMPINDFKIERLLIKVAELTPEQIADAKLVQRESTYVMLTPRERTYALWARKADFDPLIGRTPLSMLTYCGHTIIGKEVDDCLRRDTSTVDLDRGAYRTNISIVVNHTSREVLVVESEIHPPEKDQVRGAKQTAQEIKNYLLEKLYLEKIRGMMKDTIKKMSETTGEEVKKVFNDGLQAINVDIQGDKYSSILKQWNSLDFFLYAFADTEIDDKTIRKFNQQIVEIYFEGARKENTSRDEAESDLFFICSLYNSYRQPPEPLQYNAILDRLFPDEQPLITSQEGFFAVPDKTGEATREALLREVRAAKEKFIDEKKEPYLYQPDLHTVVKEAVTFIAELNAKIKIHNEAYPQCAIAYLSYDGFYSDNENELYQDLNRNQGAFVKNNLRIEDLKRQLSLQIAKCTSAEEVDENVRAIYEKIGDIVIAHNGKYSPRITLLPFAELEKYAEEAESLTPKND